MRRLLIAILCLWPLLAAANIQVTDDSGQTLTLKAPAQKLVSLAPHITELVFDAGAGDSLVGVSAYSDFPEAAKSLPVVGDANHFDIERIAALKPDLVLAWGSGTPRAAIQRLQDLGIPVAVIEAGELSDVARELGMIGKLTDHEQSALAAAKDYLDRLGDLRKTYAGRPPITVFFEISRHPLFTVNGKHPISQAIRLCGGRNVFADLDTLAPSVSLEAVLQRNPEVIVATGKGGEAARDMLRWLRWTGLAAAQYTNLYLVDGDLITRSTPRMLKGVETLCTDLDEARANRKTYGS